MAGGEIEVIRESENKDAAEEVEKEQEDMDADDDADEDSEKDDSEEEAEADKKLTELESKVKENPYMYDGHVELISALRQAGELERLRGAREAMSAVFPLSEELWLAWLKDEISMASADNAGEREVVVQLFERAVKDYLSVPVWLEYVQYSIGGMGQEGGVKRVRGVFERALTAAGLHVTKGAMIWEAYREFEAAILSGLMPAAGSVPSKEQEEKFSQQNQRVISLFKRQLSIPLIDIAETYSEYRQWMSDIEVDAKTKAAFSKAGEKLNKIRPFEDALLSAPGVESYQTYLKFEVKENDPARIQCLFERAVQQHCLVADLWIQYTGYLDRKLKVKPMVLSAYQRAVRNCPWCASLWEKYLVAMERYGESCGTIKETLEQALMSGFTESGDFLLLWTAYCDYLKRRIDWTGEHAVQLEDFRNTIQRAVEHLSEYFVPAGDPRCSLKQYWAFVEAKFCNNMEKARELWSSIMAEGHGNEAVMWLENLKIERCFGDPKHCRKLLQRALNSASDWPESIVEAYINFEREEGTLETFDQAVVKCEAQMERVQERRALAAEKEAHLDESKKSGKFDKKIGKKDNKGKQSQKTSPGQPHQKAKVKEASNKHGSQGLKPYKRKIDGSGDTKGTGVKVHPTPDSESSMAPPSGEPPVKKVKDDQTPVAPVMSHDVTKEHRTVFVSNLLYSIDEEKLRGIFTQCGQITEVRMPKNPKGKSKGFGYVEFKSEDSVSQALRMDRQEIEGRPMYVSPSIDKSKQPSQFRFSTDLEKNKLFVRGLPFTCAKEALEQIFSQHGKLKSTRLVTHKSGAPKGLAYVEFENETEAAQAILKTDGLQIGDHTISVAISHPPERRAPLKSRADAFIPSLGGGKKESEIRGKARTQVALVPRAVQKKPLPPKSSAAPKPPLTSNEEGSNEAEATVPEKETTEKMSNSDFRNMLLNK